MDATVFYGIDRAESHHDVALVDDNGRLPAKHRIRGEAAGYRILLGLLVGDGERTEKPMLVVVEVGCGLPVAALRTGERPAFAINPPTADRLRDRVLHACVGSAPITRALGGKPYGGRRFIVNNRLVNAGFLRSFAALTASPGARVHDRRRGAKGDRRGQSQRNLLNRVIGRLQYCLRSGQLFDEQNTFTSSAADLAVAA
ncbi:IS110 family transposase [Streptomyces sp. NBC_01239]|uniref:IS110 family transposase n=1 Tax=Streptomyces sp. NBC_01239 TaxID=2903792 RepID=UPI002257EB9E|nr:transposase [Streptomyces sp. NBC_01239]MCX4816576.1 IS110 family transposase [Streptomyces sp. NBC_01239]